jgi:hypothetical protein
MLLLFSGICKDFESLTLGTFVPTLTRLSQLVYARGKEEDMSETTVTVMEFIERLYLTSEGKFKIETHGQDKTITPRRAENWFKNRFPRRSWNRMSKEAHEWLARQKAA